MKKITVILFTAILVFSLYHLVRDILQIVGFSHVFTTLLHRDHAWCSPLCDYVTLPLDIIGIVGSIMVLRRRRRGLVGLAMYLLAPLWLIATLLP